MNLIKPGSKLFRVLIMLFVMLASSYSYASLENTSEYTKLKLEPGEQVSKSFKFDINKRNGQVDVLEIRAEVITEADERVFQEKLDYVMAKIVKNKPNTDIQLKLLVKDPESGERHTYEPNKFFRYSPDQKKDISALDNFLKRLHTNKTNMSLAAIRFSINGGLATTALVIGGTPLLSAAMIASGVAGFSAFFTMFPQTYVNAVFKHRFFKKNKIANYELMGIATVEQMVKMFLMEVAISIISPIGMGSVGITSDMSFMAFALLTLKLSLWVSFAQTLAERAMEEVRRRKILEGFKSNDLGVRRMSDRIAQTLKDFNKFTVIASASTMIIMVAGVVGSMYGIAFLEYLSSVTLVGLASFGIIRQIMLNPMSSNEKERALKKRSVQTLRAMQGLKHSGRVIQDLGVRLSQMGYNSFAVAINYLPTKKKLKGWNVSEPYKKEERFHQQKVQEGLIQLYRAQIGYWSQVFRGNSKSENRMASVLTGMVHSFERNAFGNSPIQEPQKCSNIGGQ